MACAVVLFAYYVSCVSCVSRRNMHNMEFHVSVTKRCMRLLGNLPEGFRNQGSSRGPWGFCQADVSGSSLAPEYGITSERQ